MRPVLISLALSAGAASAAPSPSVPSPSKVPDADVFFGFDSSSLDSLAMTDIQSVATRAIDTPGTMVVLDAHADPRGASPYNVGLSLRRAKAVRMSLMRDGVDPDRIVIAGYGEDGPRQQSYALDRRVSLTVTAEPLYSIIDGSGKDWTAIIWHEPVSYAEMKGPVDKIPQTARL